MTVKVTWRHKRSGISMRVTKKGEVLVSAPVGMERREVLRFISDHQQWIEGALERQAKARQTESSFFGQLPLTTKAEIKDASQRLQAVVAPMVEHHSEAMKVRPACITFRATRSRWGSCNPLTRRINLSIYLLLLPEWCIEHVVVHELAHLLVPNHSAAFYAIMDIHFPRWREARALTHRLSRLEEAL
ncbi:MAG: M48 family metallopeptidase [Bacteroidales bacterium]|nr:M48 family metallopeptidase [Bacteroidales bacterium]